jgi:hypothetical protein
MQMIQFDSIVNLVQMKLMKVICKTHFHWSSTQEFLKTWPVAAASIGEPPRERDLAHSQVSLCDHFRQPAAALWKMQDFDRSVLK